MIALATSTAAQSNARLAEVVRSGDVAAAMELLKKGATGHSAEPDGTTALHWAVQQDDARLVRALLTAGAQVRAANRYGVTPLALAAINGSPSMVELLLKAGADPNAASGEGETVLMAAARTGQPETLKLLLKAGADPNAAERRFGETALMWAAGHDHAEAIRVLVAGGAKPDAISAVINLPKAKVDFSFAVATALPRGGMTALMYAARQGQLNAVTALADVGANLNAVDPEGSTAIVIAIINAHYEVAARLAEKGADPNIGDAAGMAALYAAVDMMHPASLTNRPPQVRTGRLSAADLVTVLLKNRADPNVALKAPLLMRQHNARRCVAWRRRDAADARGKGPGHRHHEGAARSWRRSFARPRKRHDHPGRGPLGTGFAHADSRHADVPGCPAAARSRRRRQRHRRKRRDASASEPGPWRSVRPPARGTTEPRLDLKDASGRTPLDIALGVPAAAAPAGAAGPAGGRGARGGAGARGGPGPAAWSCACNRRRDHRVLARIGRHCSRWRSPLKKAARGRESSREGSAWTSLFSVSFQPPNPTMRTAKIGRLFRLMKDCSASLPADCQAVGAVTLKKWRSP